MFHAVALIKTMSPHGLSADPSRCVVATPVVVMSRAAEVTCQAITSASASELRPDWPLPLNPEKNGGATPGVPGKRTLRSCVASASNPSNYLNNNGIQREVICMTSSRARGRRDQFFSLSRGDRFPRARLMSLYLPMLFPQVFLRGVSHDQITELLISK